MSGHDTDETRPFHDLVAVPEGPPAGVWEQALVAVQREIRLEAAAHAGPDGVAGAPESGRVGSYVLDAEDDRDHDGGGQALRAPDDGDTTGGLSDDPAGACDDHHE